MVSNQAFDMTRVQKYTLYVIKSNVQRPLAVVRLKKVIKMKTESYAKVSVYFLFESFDV